MSLWPRTPARAVLFDLYGTLVDISIDTDHPDIWAEFAGEIRAHRFEASAMALRARYEQLVERERRKHGFAFVLERHFFANLLRSSGRTAMPPDLVRYLGGRFRDLTTRKLQLRTYALELLERIRRSGCKTALVSNTEEIVTTRDLSKLRLLNYFDAIVISATVGVKKPDGRIFAIALDKLNVRATEALFVGDDHVADFKGASDAGLTPVLVCGGTHPADIRCTAPRLQDLLDALKCNGWSGLPAFERQSA